MENFAGKAQALVMRLKDVRAEEEVVDILEEFRFNAEVDWYIFAVSQVDSLLAPKYKVLTNADHWMKIYAENMLHQKDPVVKYILTHNTPVYWNSFVNQEGYNDPEQLSFMEQASEAGLKAGFSIPCNSYANFAVFSIADNDPGAYARFEEVVPHSYLFSNQLLETMLRLNYSTPEQEQPPKLTSRELECLLWGSEGKTAWEISKIIGVSERTIVFHFTNAAEKLNASSRQHAVSKALLMGLIKPKF